MFFKILISIIIVYISIESKNWKILLKNVLIFYLVTFTFGGVALSLLYFIKPENITMKNGVYTGTYPIKIAFIGGIIGLGLVILSFSIIKKKISKRTIYCSITVCINKKIETVKALLDTGNFLKEPITGYPVVIVEINMLKNVLPQYLIDNLNSIIKGNIKENEGGDEILSKLRVIPFNSLGKQNGMLLGVKADYIVVNNTEGDVKINNVIIGLYDGHLTRDGKYNALISLELLEK